MERNTQVKAGSFTGTGDEYNLELGFIPAYIKLWNYTDGDIVQEWFYGMADGYALQTTNDASTQQSLETSNGISDFPGEAPNKTLTGTLTFTAASASVSGSGTDFLTQLKAGDTIKTPEGYEYTVLSISSATALTLSAVATETESGVTCVRQQGRSPGVIVGTTMSESSKTIYYLALGRANA